MKTKLFLIILVMMFMCSGCKTLPPSNKPEVNTLQDIKNAQKTVEESSKIIEKASGKITTEAHKIIVEATEAQSKVPENAKAVINPHLISIKESSTSILEDTTIINKASAKLDGAKSLLDGAGKKVIIVETALNKITNERDAALVAQKKAEEDRDSQMQKMLQWLIISCIVGCGAFTVLFFFTGSKGGLMAAGGCGLVLIIAIFVNKFITYLAIGGGVLLLFMAGVLLYNIYIKNKAFSEVINTVEVVKNNLTEDKKIELFGKKKNGVINDMQNNNTKTLVKIEKKKISNLWDYSKNKKE